MVGSMLRYQHKLNLFWKFSKWYNLLIIEVFSKKLGSWWGRREEGINERLGIFSECNAANFKSISWWEISEKAIYGICKEFNWKLRSK